MIDSDFAFNLDICGAAAAYFPRFSQEDLAELVIQTSKSPEKTAAMRDAGIVRSQAFSWDKHVERLLILAKGLTGNV